MPAAFREPAPTITSCRDHPTAIRHRLPLLLFRSRASRHPASESRAWFGLWQICQRCVEGRRWRPSIRFADFSRAPPELLSGVTASLRSHPPPSGPILKARKRGAIIASQRRSVVTSCRFSIKPLQLDRRTASPRASVHAANRRCKKQNQESRMKATRARRVPQIPKLNLVLPVTARIIPARRWRRRGWRRRGQ